LLQTIFSSSSSYFSSRNFDFPYGKSLYKAYDLKIAEVVRPIAIEISNTKDCNIDSFFQSDSKTVAKKLFELYMALKVFSDKGLEFFGDCKFATKNYFNWFSGGIDKWNEVSVFSALSRYAN
jgi:hypothetical protein